VPVCRLLATMYSDMRNGFRGIIKDSWMQSAGHGRTCCFLEKMATLSTPIFTIEILICCRQVEQQRRFLPWKSLIAVSKLRWKIKMWLILCLNLCSEWAILIGHSVRCQKTTFPMIIGNTTNFRALMTFSETVFYDLLTTSCEGVFPN
jgi:hypothetical protein